MAEISTSVNETIGLLVWSDWLTMMFLVVFIGFGIKHGLLVEIIDLSFLITAILGAYLFHQSLSHLSIIQLTINTYQSQLVVAFGIIFVAILIFRKAFYQLTSASSAISNPCALNKFFALLVLLMLNLFVSWYYVNSMANFKLISYFITNDALRLELSFMLLFAIISGIVLLLKKAFDISVKTNESCFFQPLFKVILTNLQNINTALNASNTSPIKKTWGGVIGLIKGCVLIIMVILVLQNIDFIIKQNFWVESQNLFKAFQDMATNIRSELVKHLLFIRK